MDISQSDWWFGTVFIFPNMGTFIISTDEYVPGRVQPPPAPTRSLGYGPKVMYENYISCLSTEAETMVDMTETGILPACAKDLQKSSTANQKYNVPRKVAYEAIVDEFLWPVLVENLWSKLMNSAMFNGNCESPVIPNEWDLQ